MKYMKWKDLEPGDVLRISDEFLRSKNYTEFFDKYKDKDLIISKIEFAPQRIIIYDQFNDGFWDISYNGFDMYTTNEILLFKIIKLKETL